MRVRGVLNAEGAAETTAPKCTKVLYRDLSRDRAATPHTYTHTYTYTHKTGTVHTVSARLTPRAHASDDVSLHARRSGALGSTAEAAVVRWLEARPSPRPATGLAVDVPRVRLPGPSSNNGATCGERGGEAGGEQCCGEMRRVHAAASLASSAAAVAASAAVAPP